MDRIWIYFWTDKFDFAALKKSREAIDRSVIPMMAVSNAMGLNRWRTCTFYVMLIRLRSMEKPLRPSISWAGAHPFLLFLERIWRNFCWEELRIGLAIAVETCWCAPLPLGVQTDLFVRGGRLTRKFDSRYDGLMEEMEKQNLPLHKHTLHEAWRIRRRSCEDLFWGYDQPWQIISESSGPNVRISV